MFVFLCPESYYDDKYINRCILRSYPVKIFAKKMHTLILVLIVSNHYIHLRDIVIYECYQSKLRNDVDFKWHFTNQDTIIYEYNQIIYECYLSKKPSAEKSSPQMVADHEMLRPK